MTQNDGDKIRADFEEFCVSIGLNPEKFDSIYLSCETHFAWLSWMAAAKRYMKPGQDELRQIIGRRT